MRAILVVAVSAAALGALACAGRKAHLIEGFGASHDAAFAAQRQPRTAPAPAVTGLDPQEAAIVGESYRNGLAPPGQKAKEQPVILLAPPSRDHVQGPAPSVPRE